MSASSTSASTTPGDLDKVIALLGELIGYRTENPTGDELALCHRLENELKARKPDRVEVVEVPRTGKSPGGYVFATYGQPKTVINVHLDTVPVNQGWTRDPFRAEVVDDRLYGLGSSDTKGAMAAALTAIDRVGPQTLRDIGILFSGDEEAGSQVMEAFAASERIQGIERAIVCEPTRRRAGVRHRGIRAYRAEVRGKGGHSSTADHMPRPIVTMARLAVALDEIGKRHLDDGPDDMKGLCMNVAVLDGGVAYNVVPEQAQLGWSIRQPPGFDIAALEDTQERAAAAADPDNPISLELAMAHDPFACRDPEFFKALLGDFVTGFVPLDFWTEAAMFATAGIDAVVVGPGDIAQAHAADEFVTLDDLAWATDLFTHILSRR